MKIELSDVESCVKRISIQVPQERVEREKVAVFSELAKSAHVPGFRKGKVPKKVIEQRYGKSALGDVAQRIINDAYREALEKNNINPVGDPVIEDVIFEENAPLSFSATVEVLPEVNLKDFEGTAVKKKVAKVSEAELDKAIETYRERMARMEPVSGRAAGDGDYVFIDYNATRDGAEVAPLSGQAKQVHLRQDDMLEGVYAGIRGMKPGEEKDFKAQLPKEFPDPALAGAELDFHVKLLEIKEKVLPPADDNLAKEISEFDTLEAFRDSLRRSIQRRNETMSENNLRDDVLAVLIKENPFDLPPRMVERRARVLAERTERRFAESGVDMRSSEYKREDFMARFRESAGREIREEIILASAARKEKVEVGEEDINHEISHLARMIGQPEDKVKTQLAQSDGLIGLYQKVVFDKAYKAVLGKLKIEEETTES